MESAATVEFSRAARALSRAARRDRLVAPSFRSPPQIVGAARTVRRRPGGALVCVRLRDRPLVAVVADMIEGVVVANELSSPDADRVRAALWEAVGYDLQRDVAAHPGGAPEAGAA